jgi:hypothetical protein
MREVHSETCECLVFKMRAFGCLQRMLESRKVGEIIYAMLSLW